MRHERRNHYRTLQVQPGAHPDLITASYRRLMSGLRHPSGPGFDREAAARLDEAYAVLRHPQKRKAYDLQRMSLRRPPQDSAATVSVRNPLAVNHCPFCGAKAPAIIAAASRCTSCDAPLAPVVAMGPLSMPYHGRAHARTPQAAFARLRLERTGPIYNAKLRDLSVGGLSFFSGKQPPDGSLLQVMTPKVDTVARVVRVRPHGPVSIVHAQMLTACYLNRAGALVPVGT